MNRSESVIFLDKALDSYEYYFTHFLWPTLNPGTKLSYCPAIEFMCELGQAFYEGKHRQTTLAIPPRNGKTSVLTIGLPTWIWLKDPRKDILTSSASDDVILDFHKDHKVIWGCPDYKLFQDILFRSYVQEGLPSKWRSCSVESTENAMGGKHHQWKAAKSRTGLGYHYGFLDDMISFSDAQYPNHCAKMFRELEGGHLRRRHEKQHGIESPTMIIQQRVASGDFIGRLQDEPGWEHFTLPAISKNKTVILMPVSGKEWVREEGDVLNPERENLETLLKIRGSGSEGIKIFETQYQQDPDNDISDAVITYDTLEFFDEFDEEYAEVILSADTAATTGKKSSNWGVVILGRRFNKQGYHVLYAHAQKYNYPDGKKKILELIERFSVGEVYVEAKSTGLSLIPELRSIVGREFSVEEILPSKQSKEERFMAAVPALLQKVSYPRLTSLPGEIWVMLLLKELVGFPNCATRDLADSISQYFNKKYPSLGKKKGQNLKKFYGTYTATADNFSAVS